MRVTALLTLAVVLASRNAAAQPTVVPTEGQEWSFAASAYTYVIADSENYLQPTVTADRGRLHVEARFNYEDLETGSAWVGANFSAGEQVTFEITPIIGAVFGSTNGVAPGYKASLGWRRLELYSELEYVFDLGDSGESFLYTWSELGLAPADWWHLGIVVQRTKVYETGFDIQRGFFAGTAFGQAEVTAYLLNPDASPPTFVLGVSIDF